jgi:cation:H+ antiporter
MFPHIAKEDMGSLYFGLLVASVIPLVLVYFTHASQIMGIILLVIFIVYLYQLSKIKTVREEGSLGEAKRKLPRYGALTFSGALFVVLSSFFIVDAASFLATILGVPPVVIGATIIAFGTSIPELATSLQAVKQGHPEIAFGNVVGSCFINITLILGVPLITSPFRVDMTAFLDLVVFSLIANLFLWYFLTSERISWREGAVLLCIYALFLATTFGVIQLP